MANLLQSVSNLMDYGTYHKFDNYDHDALVMIS
jgi:hypothetical protein